MPHLVTGWPRPEAERTPAEPSLLDTYLDLFDVVPADTDEKLIEAHRLRYQVYCIDNAFEDASHYPDGLERDGFDSHAAHGLLVHRRTGKAIGTVRLILPSASARPFPVLSVFDGEWPCPLNRTAEISRFSVSREARSFLASHGTNERMLMPFITLGLMRAIVQMTVANGVEFWLASMEPTLLRLLGRLGIEFQPLGGLVEYHGLRQTCYAHAGSLLEGIRLQRPEVWEVITDQGRLQPSPAGRA